MKILLIKTSSMGDVIHNLPLVADITRAYPHAKVDWVVEEAYAGLVRLHPGVRQVIPVAWRRWRKTLHQRATRTEIKTFVQQLRAVQYDTIIDTQALLKSAVLARLACGVRVGYVAASCREPLAALFYQRRLAYPPIKTVHAVQRYRDLAAWALQYPVETAPHYGLSAPALPDAWQPSSAFNAASTTRPYAVLLHGTARASKLWPEARWVELIQALHQNGIHALLAWGNSAEKQRAERLAANGQASVAPRAFNLEEWAQILSQAAVVVGLDTGLTYLAAAVGTPVVAVYCDTSPAQAGVEVDTPHCNLGGIGAAPSAAEVIEAALKLQR